MTGFDHVLVDPAGRELAEALAEAARVAAWEFHRQAVGVVDWGGFAGGLVGLFGHLGPPEAFCSLPSLERRNPASRVALAWWTDPHGRRHYRAMSRHARNGAEWPGSFPPLWWVYPGRLCLRTRGATRELVATCGCGVCGRPDDLGWAGPWCGPCADHRAERAEAGLPPPREPQTVFREERPLAALELSPDGRYLACVGRAVGSAVSVSDLRTGGPAPHGGREWFRLAAFGPGGDWLVTADTSRLVVVDAATGKVRSRLGVGSEDRPARTAAVGPDGSLALGYNNGVTLSALAGGEYRVTAHWLGGRVDALRFSPDGSRVLAFGGELTACLDRGLVPLWQRPGAVAPPAVSPDGSRAAVPGQTGVELLDMATGRLVASLVGVRAQAVGLAFHPRLPHLVSAHVDGTVALWSLGDHRLHATYEAQPHGVTATALSPDGRTLATAGTDGAVRVWPWEELLSA